MLEGFFLRRPAETDIENILALMIRCDIRDVGFPDSDLTDLRYDWSQIDLSRDAWIAIDAKGKISGYGAVLPWGTGRRLAIYDDPGTEQSEMFLGLLLLCEGRASAVLEQGEPGKGRDIVTHISNSALGQQSVLEQWGYHSARHIFNMHRDLTDDLITPDLPPSVAIRPVVPEQDIRQLYELIQTAFDWRDRKIQPFEEWKAFMLREDSFDPGLWILAEASGEVIGACLCLPLDGIGWIRQFAVRKEWRKQGIGRGLLLHAFQAFKQRHYIKAGLSVEGENADACQFYERLGMTRAVHLIEYVKMVQS